MHFGNFEVMGSKVTTFPAKVYQSAVDHRVAAITWKLLLETD